MRALAGLLLLAVAAAAAEPRWRLRYFYDEPREELAITDLQFASARHGVAVAALRRDGRWRPFVLRTTDAGENWRLIPIPDRGLSLFLLDESVGWMAAEKGLWKTRDGGATWTRVPGPRNVLRVWFASENRGWAIGLEKGVWETRDGGRRWTPLPVLDQVRSTREFTVFEWITFVSGRHGLIAGASSRPRDPDASWPEWMDPEAAEARRQRPTLSILLETRDGGETWKHSTTSMFGRITRVRLAADGRGLGLVEFHDAFPWRSEVFRLDWRTGHSERVFRREDRAVTDVALLDGGPAYLAAVEPPGKLRRSPVPGRLRILESHDLTHWNEMPIDYRAVARRAVLAAAPSGGLWAATDTGMILSLDQTPR
ncbi:MAG: hypothetical protein NZM33_15520 [Bryobacteraceae bacterium]|nr:hypothetical protein [Bryobacteraceae bacterium]